MKNAELRRQYQVIEDLYLKTKSACGSDLELTSHWAKYQCVLCAGLLENAIAIIYGAMAKKQSSPVIANFTERTLRRVQNPKTSRFLEIAGAFSKTWRVELEKFVDENGRRDAIDSIMNHRHKIAHGQASSITIAQLRNYFAKSIEVVDYIETQCGTS